MQKGALGSLGFVVHIATNVILGDYKALKYSAVI